MPLTREERETIIRTDEASDWVNIWTCSRSHMNHIKKDERYEILSESWDDESFHIEARVPKKNYNIMGGMKRRISDEQKEAMRARMQERIKENAKEGLDAFGNPLKDKEESDNDD